MHASSSSSIDPETHPVTSTLSSAPPLPKSLPPVSPTYRPVSTPIPYSNARNHPTFQSRSASFYYDPQKFNLNLKDLTNPASSSIDSSNPPPLPLLKPPRASFVPNERRTSAIQSILSPSHRAYFIPFASFVQVVLVFVSFILNWVSLNSPIQTNPFNYMLGPVPEILIQMGSLYAPCMRPSTTLIPSNPSSFVPCNLHTKQLLPQTAGKYACRYEDLCGPLSTSSLTPNQGFRVLIAVFLHSGLVHLIFNLFMQVMSLKAIEQVWGGIRIGLVYLISGTYGFFLSGTLSSERVQSVGASGAIFGCLGCFFLDLIVHWHSLQRPLWELMKFLLVITVSFVLGLLPWFDNFAHLGGFAMGTLVAMAFMPLLPSEKAFLMPSSHPLLTFSFWKSKPISSRLIITWFVRLIGLIASIVLYVVTVQAFYNPSIIKSNCPWCPYLSCLPMIPYCADYL